MDAQRPIYPHGARKKGVAQFHVGLCASTYRFYIDFAIFAEKVEIWHRKVEIQRRVVEMWHRKVEIWRRKSRFSVE